MNLFIHLFISMYLAIYIYLAIYLHPCMHLSIYLYPCIDVSIYPSMYIRVGMYIYLFPISQIIKGSDPIEIKVVPVVRVSFNLAVSLDDFFNVGQLNHNLAFALRIDPSSIRTVE